MYKIRVLLLALMACSLSVSVHAQTNVNIEIKGLEPTLESNVRLFLSIEQQKSHPLLSEGRLLRLHKKATQDISAALQPFGYYRPLIEPKLEKTGTEQWLASYSIDPGLAISIGEYNFVISAEISRDPEFKKLLEYQALKVGDVFSHPEYEAFKNGLARLAAERGYFRAKFVEHRVEIDLEAYVARIYLNYNGGPRYRFGAVSLRQDVLEAELLQRYIPFEAGDSYTLDALIELQQVLNDTDYFQSVEVVPGPASAESDEIPIEVSMTPRKENRYTFGLGYGTDTGARTKFGWQKPNVNKRGHRFASEIGVSELGYRALANYRIPVLNPRTDQVVFSIGEEKEEFEDSQSTLRTLGVSLSHNRGKWREILSLGYQQEDFVVADQADDSTLLIPRISWSRTWGGNFINVLDGLRFDISLRGADRGFVSDTDFGQLQGNLKFITSLTASNRLIARGGFGTTSTRDFDQLPTSFRFYTGGGQSVRGYAFQSLGPTDADGQVVGASKLLTGSIEFEHSFNPKWGGAVFYDIGNAIDNFDDDLERGAGFGLRWRSPVGPVRIDLASAISRDDKPWRLHINIGPDL
jgi:translocation and assembly module TamA